MYETDSGITLRDELYMDDYDDMDWPTFDDCDLFDQSYVCLDKGELASYTVGAVVAAAMILQGSLVLDYPPSYLLAPTEDVMSADAVATFSVICLLTCTIGLFVSASGLRRATLWDGVISSYTALGIYLFPQLTMHQPFLVIAIVAGIALAIWDYRDNRPANSLAKIAWYVVTNTALASLLLVNLGGAGLIPMASSHPSANEDTPRGAEVLSDLFDRESLDDMSYQEVADTLQEVVRVEADRLGLQGHEPQVLVGYTGSATANYNARTNAITLNASMLSRPRGLSGYDAVECVAHEMAHAYENAVVNGTIKGKRNSPLGNLTPGDTARWQVELNSNVDSSRHFAEYWRQDIEVRARGYADNEMLYLFAMADQTA